MDGLRGAGDVVLEPGTIAELRSTPVRNPLGLRLVRVSVVVAALVPVALYVVIALRQLGYPYELEWMEGGSVEIVGRVLRAQAIYVAPSLHYVPYTYPPLYFWLSALVAHVTGLSFLPLRLVSFTSSLGCFAVLFWLVRRETGDAVAGLVAAGLFAATYQVGGAWLDIGRVDSLWLLFLLLAVALARQAETWKGGVLVGLVLSAALLTKQSTLLAAAPLVAYLVVVRRRVGVVALGAWAVVVVGSTLVLDALSHGWYDYYVFTELLHQGTEASIWWRFVPGDLIGRVGWMLGLGVLGLIVYRRRSGTTTPWGFWLAVTAGFVGVSWVSRAHVGGGQDVLIPAFAALSALGGLGYEAVRRRVATHATGIEILLLAVLIVQLAWIGGHPAHLVPTPADQRAGQRFVAMVESTPGQVIVLDHPWYDTLAGKPSWAQDEAIHDVLRAGPSQARTDLLRSIGQELAAPEVTAVYTDSTSIDPALGDALQRYFRLSRQPVFSCFQCFFPVTDVAFRPYLHYVRR